MLRRALVAFVFAVLSLTLASAAHAQTGLSGHVKRASDNSNVDGAGVIVYSSGGGGVAFLATDGAGNFELTGIPADTYYVVASGDGLVAQVWKGSVGANVPCTSCNVLATGTGVPVVDDQITGGIDFALAAGARLTGTVKDAVTSAGVDGALVLFSANDFGLIDLVSTDATGTYTSRVAFQPGTYRVVVATTGDYLGQFYGGTPCDNVLCDSFAATPVIVAGTADVTGLDVLLAKGGRVAGKVTNSTLVGPSAEIDGAFVSLFNPSGGLISGVFTNVTGDYTSDLVRPGSYFLETSAAGFLSEVFDDLSCLICSPSTGTPIVVTAGATAPVDIALTPGATISGTVLEVGTGTPIAFAQVSVHDAGGQPLASAQTSPSGEYAVSSLPAGSYIVKVTPSFGDGHLAKVYSGPGGSASFNCASCDLRRATPVIVGTGATVSGIDFSLDLGAVIGGKVVADATGDPIAAGVGLRNESEFVAFAGTDSTGAYVVSGVPPGTYYVQVFNVNGYLPELYAGGGTPGSAIHVVCVQCSIASGTPLAVAAGQSLLDVNFRLTPAYSISGTATKAGGGPASGITVWAYDRFGTRQGADATDSLGQYSVGNLAPGTYYLEADGANGLLTQLYERFDCSNCAPAGGTPVTITTASVTARDFVMNPGGRISGRVLNPSGAPLDGSATFMGVTVLDATGRVVDFSSVDADGNWITSRGLPPGIYYAATLNFTTQLNTLYNNVPCVDCSAISGTQIAVAAGTTTTGIDLKLFAGGTIKGTVTGSLPGGGTGPLDQVVILVSDQKGNFVSFAVTNSAGTYTVNGVPPGTAFVSTQSSGVYINQLYNGQPCINCAVQAGTPVAVVAGSTTTGIDFLLGLGGSISGVITSADTNLLLGDIAVAAYTESGEFVKATFSSFDGAYTLQGLAPGNYFLAASSFTGYLGMLKATPADLPCLDCDPTAGRLYTVVAAATTSGVDFTLTLGGQITGRVTTDSGVPLEEVLVSLVEPGKKSTIDSRRTDLQGNYSFNGVPAGDYLLQTSTVLGFIDQVYNGFECVECDAVSGTVVTVASGQKRTGIDFSLKEGASVSGVVTDAGTGQPLPTITVEIYAADGRFVDASESGPTGRWSSARGLPAGTYYLRTVNNDGYVDRQYDGISCSLCPDTTGTPVVLTLGSPRTGIDFALERAGTVTGLVQSASGAGIEGVIVELSDGIDSRFEGTTNAEGRYRIVGLYGSTYEMRTRNTSGYVDQVRSIALASGATAENVNFTLAAGGTIAGIVSAANGGARVAGQDVIVYTASGASVDLQTTNGAGIYRTTGLPAGQYLVRTSGETPDGLINMVHADVVCQSCPPAAGTPVTVTVGVTTTVNFSLPAGGSISGTVRRSGGTPVGLDEVTVEILNADGDVLASAPTKANGTYTVRGLASGSYVARTTNVAGLINQQYDGGSCTGCSVEIGTPIAVTAGADTPGIDFTMPAGGVVSGKITNAATGTPIAGVTVTIYSTSNPVVSKGETDNLGRYRTADGIPSGSYFARTTNEVGFIDSADTVVNVAAGQTTGDVNFILAKGGQISGVVTDALSGQPIANATVDVTHESGASAASVTTNSAGRYVAPALPAGSYFARASAHGHVTQIHGGADCSRCVSTAGTPIAVGSSPVAVDFALASGGRIAGTVIDATTGQPIRDMTIDIYDSTGDAVSSAETNAGGEYISVDGLVPGTYYVGTTNTFGYVNQIYHAAVCAGCKPHWGRPVTVTANTTTGGINFSLSLGGRIGGIVKGDGQPLAVAGVTIFTASGYPLTTAVAGTDGRYLTGAGLPAGTYYAVTANRAGFVDELYAGNSCGYSCAVTSGTGIPVTVGSATSGIDFNLSPGRRVRGTVTEKSTGRPLSGARVDILNAARVVVAFGETAADGRYNTLGGLKAGTYTVRATYLNADAPLVAATSTTPITIAAADVSGIDFALEQGEVIAGRIVDATTGLPISAVVVELTNAAGDVIGSGDTSDAGTYVIQSAAPAGTYFVHTTNPWGYVNEVYDDRTCLACDPARGTPIVVDGAGRTDGINFALVLGGSLGGRVTTAEGTPLAGVAVRFYTQAGSFVGESATNANGDYVSPGLPASRYLARTSNLSGFIDAVFNGVSCVPCQLSDGTPVLVTRLGVSSGIDFNLQPGGLLSGYLRSGGSPLEGVTVSIYRDGVLFARTNPTDENGYYAISLPVGDYTIEPSPAAGFRLVTAGLTGSALRIAVTVSLGTNTSVPGFDLAVCSPLTVGPVSLPVAGHGQPYSTTLSATGGTAPYAFSVAEGDLIPGLTLSSAGVLQGTPAVAGTGSFTIAAVDGNSCAGTRAMTLTSCSYFLSTSSISLGAQPGAAHVELTSAAGDCGWTVTTNAAWVTITSATSGNGSATLSFAFASNPGAAARSAVVTVGARTVSITQAGLSTSPAFGAVDTPENGVTGITGSLPVTGWALDDVEVKRVRVSRDSISGEPAGEVFIGDATFIDGARPDVAAGFPTLPFSTRAGWGYLLLTNMLPNQGTGPFTLHMDATDAEGNVTRLGSRTFVGDNANAVKPFGAIDTPGQGETVSGSGFINFGWALTQNPKSIATDGSTITIFVDGAAVGRPTYNNFRPDVAALFPGLANTGGAIGFKVFDTTTWTNGVHAIAWIVSDSNGSAEGIGSRYFTVNNVLANQRFQPSLASMRAGAVTGPTSGPALTARVGFSTSDLPLELKPDATGGYTTAVGQLGRVELRFGGACGAVTGALIANGQPEKLPVGSTLDRSGFAWMPGPAFIGTYQLEFTVPSCSAGETKIPVTITVLAGK